MKERPIILKAHEVRGILEGRQTQLRRVLKFQPLDGYDFKRYVAWPPNMVSAHFTNDVQDKWDGKLSFACPFGQVGDRLWGRETFSSLHKPETQEYKSTTLVSARKKAEYGFHPDRINPAYEHFYYKASLPQQWEGITPAGPWKPSTQMPRIASRILLEIVSVRVERYSAMTDDDAYACGVQSVNASNDAESFEYADKVSMRGPKQAYLLSEKNESAWCWVIEFKRVDA